MAEFWKVSLIFLFIKLIDIFLFDYIYWWLQTFSIFKGQSYKLIYFSLSKEEQLVAKLQNLALKDSAFNELLDTYQERLYWHIRKLVITHENADDVLQNTFLRIYKSLPNFQQKSSLHTWMYRIAYNESLRFLEENKKNIFIV